MTSDARMTGSVPPTCGLSLVVSVDGSCHLAYFRILTTAVYSLFSGTGLQELRHSITRSSNLGLCKLPFDSFRLLFSEGYTIRPGSMLHEHRLNFLWVDLASQVAQVAVLAQSRKLIVVLQLFASLRVMGHQPSASNVTSGKSERHALECSLLLSNHATTPVLWPIFTRIKTRTIRQLVCFPWHLLSGNDLLQVRVGLT